MGFTPEFLMEDYKGNLIPCPSKRSSFALDKAAEKMGWKNQYWMSYGAYEITKEELEEYKEKITKLYENLKNL